MKIILNGEPREIASATLAEAVAECGFSGKVATALNERFVPAAARGSTALKDGDRLEVLAAMQGG